MKIKLSLLFLFIYGIAHGQNDTECKYLQVVAYMTTNSQFNDQIKTYLTLNKNEKKQKVFEFNVTPWIQFIELREFKNKVSADSTGIEKETIAYEKMFFKKYNFEPYKSSYLEKIFTKNSSRYFLTFSRIINNILLVEILNFENHPKGIRRIGSGVKILFHFDQTEVISKYQITSVHYN
ncbi:MAG: hypothetical protein U0U70_17535 [Chitinophagaceae bacterium]